MAEDNTVEAPSVEGGGEQTLEGLRQELASKQEELAGLRAQREQAQREAVEKVQRAQLVEAIRRVDAEIDAEEQQLQIQQGLDPQQVGIGVPTEEVPVPPPVVDPEKVADQVADTDQRTEDAPVLQTLEYGAVAQPVAPENADDTSEGDEN